LLRPALPARPELASQAGSSLSSLPIMLNGRRRTERLPQFCARFHSICRTVESIRESSPSPQGLAHSLDPFVRLSANGQARWSCHLVRATPSPLSEDDLQPTELESMAKPLLPAELW